MRTFPLHRLDADALLLKEAFDTAYEAGCFALYTYPPEEQERHKFDLFQTLTPLSGTLAFLAVQILAANKIMAANGFSLKERYFNHKCGIAINHLRAPFTVVRGEKTSSGFALTGRLTWASGYGIFDHLVVGFHHDGRELEAVIPFSDQKGMTIGAAPETFVGFGMNTVDIDLESYEVPDEYIISSKPMGTYTKAKSLSKTVHYALYGIGLGILEDLDDPEVRTQAREELESIKSDFVACMDGDEMDRLRIRLFSLLHHTVTVGMILVGGKSILSEQNLQRYYRELIMFNSNGLNDTIKGLFKRDYLTR